jgi:hypothetical protein
MSPTIRLLPDKTRALTARITRFLAAANTYNRQSRYQLSCALKLARRVCHRGELAGPAACAKSLKLSAPWNFDIRAGARGDP